MIFEQQKLLQEFRLLIYSMSLNECARTNGNSFLTGSENTSLNLYTGMLTHTHTHTHTD